MIVKVHPGHTDNEGNVISGPIKHFRFEGKGPVLSKSMVDLLCRRGLENYQPPTEIRGRGMPRKEADKRGILAGGRRTDLRKTFRLVRG